MPQMSPMNWLLMFFFSYLYLMFFISLIYFNNFFFFLNSLNLKFNKNLNWYWLW